MIDQPQPTTKKEKSWLQRLKDESWEAELLVSAVSIFAIFQAFGLIDGLVNFFIDKLPPEQYEIGYFITVAGYLAFGMLGAFFVIHFGLRAFWIGLVGLNSVFPDYSLEDSAYSKIYTEKLIKKLPKLTKTIEVFDEICSVLFSGAFALLLIYLYMTATCTLYLLLYNWLSAYIPSWVLLIPVFLILFVICFQMVMITIGNLKAFRTNAKIQHLYFLVSFWGNKLGYGPFYKTLLQITMIFGSNFKKKKSLVKTMLFLVVFGMALGMYKLMQSNFQYLLLHHRAQDTTTLQPAFYSENNIDNSFLLYPEISESVVTNNTLKLFIPIFNAEVEQLRIQCNITSKRFIENDSIRQTVNQEFLDCYQKNYAIFLDTRKIVVSFLRTDHPLTGQFGIIGFLDVSELSKGPHTLKIEKKKGDQTAKSWEIPFYYSPE